MDSNPSQVCTYLFMHFCPGTITTQAESINSDLQRGLDRCLRHTHTTLNTKQNQLVVEFLRIQIPTDRTSATRTRATQMLTAA